MTVEEIVDELEPRPHSVVLPAWAIAAVCHVPGGAHPSYAPGYSTRDNDFYSAWDEIARDRDALLGVDARARDGERAGAGVSVRGSGARSPPRS